MKNQTANIITGCRIVCSVLLLALTVCHIVPDYLTFIDDYLMTVEFIDWLKDFYLGKAKLLM